MIEPTISNRIVGISFLVALISIVDGLTGCVVDVVSAIDYVGLLDGSSQLVADRRCIKQRHTEAATNGHGLIDRESAWNGNTVGRVLNPVVIDCGLRPPDSVEPPMVNLAEHLSSGDRPRPPGYASGLRMPIGQRPLTPTSVLSGRGIALLHCQPIKYVIGSVVDI